MCVTEPPSNSDGVMIPYFVQGDADFRLLQKTKGACQ